MHLIAGLQLVQVPEHGGTVGVIVDVTGKDRVIAGPEAGWPLNV